MSQFNKQAGTSFSNSEFQVYSCLQLIRRGPPTLGRSRNILPDPHRIMSDQMSGHPMVQSGCHIQLAITGW